MVTQVAKWGNSQGVRIPRKLLRAAGIELEDNVTVMLKDSGILIQPADKRPLKWYLESYDDNSDDDRYDWGELDEPKGRELL